MSERKAIELLRREFEWRFEQRKGDASGCEYSVWKCIECGGESDPEETIFEAEHVYECSAMELREFLAAHAAAPQEPEAQAALSIALANVMTHHEEAPRLYECYCAHLIDEDCYFCAAINALQKHGRIAQQEVSK